MMKRIDSLPALPHNPEAEKSVLGSMLLDNSTIDDVIADAGLTADDFFLPCHRVIYQTILDLSREEIPADPVTVASRLSDTGKLEAAGGTEFLHDIIGIVPHAAHAKYYAGKVKDDSQRREIITACCKTIQEAATSPERPQDIAASADSLFHRIIARDAGNGPVSVQATLREWQTALASGPAPGIPTGFNPLDELLGGGFRKGNEIILAARPSVGKTALAAGFALNVAGSGHPVFFVSLEQSRLELTERFLSSLARIAVSSVRDPRRFGAESRGKLAGAQAHLENLPILIDDTAGLTLAQVTAQARLIKRRSGLGLLILDYLQLLLPEDRRQPREQQVAGMARGLKLLARDLSIPVLCLAQLNRAVEGRDSKRPRLSDLRESGAIEQDADLVMFLDRPGAHDREARTDEATLILAKNRHGAPGDIPLAWNGPCMTYQDADDGRCPI